MANNNGYIDVTGRGLVRAARRRSPRSVKKRDARTSLARGLGLGPRPETGLARGPALGLGPPPRVRTAPDRSAQARTAPRAAETRTGTQLGLRVRFISWLRTSFKQFIFKYFDCLKKLRFAILHF